jgi:acetolactate synthase I/II/III large subunit
LSTCEEVVVIKVSDYIAKFFAERGSRHVFMITGGGAMHLNDSFGQSKDLEFFCFQHEQASAFAAEGYYRASGRLPIVNVTSGPGGTNTLSGVIGQWLDSIPAVYISGQVKQETTISSCPELGLRQLGDQEINIVDIVKPVTKYAVMVRDAREIHYHLSKAFYLATHGRPGPVWLDIPLDIQSAKVDESALRTYDPKEDELKIESSLVQSQIAEVIRRIKEAKRPVILAGHGIRLAGAANEFRRLTEQLRIPVLTAICGHDLINSDNPLFFGRPGICGDRLGNIVIQNSDLMIAIGARLGIRQISYNYASFARGAFRVMVDIDKAELSKPTLTIDLPIHSDAKYFVNGMISQLNGESLQPKSVWIRWCEERKRLLPGVISENKNREGYVNSYEFADLLFKQLVPGTTVVTGNGTAYTGTFQIMQIKDGVRVFTNQGCASMGYCLPAAIGASMAGGQRPVVLITGDGSIQMNIQELQTVVAYRLSIKIFVLVNDGYLAIRTTQNAYFDGRHYGSSPEGRLFLPDIRKIAEAYGIPTKRIKGGDSLGDRINDVLSTDGPCLCEIWMDPQQTLYPKLSSTVGSDGKMISSSLENMFPFLEIDVSQKDSIEDLGWGH